MENNNVTEVTNENINYEEIIADIDARILSMLLMAQNIQEHTSDYKIMAKILMIYEYGVEARNMLKKVEKFIGEES